MHCADCARRALIRLSVQGFKSPRSVKKSENMKKYNRSEDSKWVHMHKQPSRTADARCARSDRCKQPYLRNLEVQSKKSPARMQAQQKPCKDAGTAKALQGCRHGKSPASTQASKSPARMQARQKPCKHAGTVKVLQARRQAKDLQGCRQAEALQGCRHGKRPARMQAR